MVYRHSVTVTLGLCFEGNQVMKKTIIVVMALSLVVSAAYPSKVMADYSFENKPEESKVIASDYYFTDDELIDLAKEVNENDPETEEVKSEDQYDHYDQEKHQYIYYDGKPVQ